ncbi:MAG TPA: glycosyltransferase family 2 protein [Patescibacteria group bacterium]|nr:glycosyltransferase family 2 protein [Patescibacteria group bacterium]
MNRSVSIVSPIYNDRHSLPFILPELVKELKKAFRKWEIVLIDDASFDGSREWARNYCKNISHIKLFFHSKNEGIATTYRELYSKAKGDIIVLFSLDGEWDPGDTLRLAKTLDTENDDIVVGVRRQKRYTVWRSMVSALYNTFTSYFFGVDTRDAGSIKAFRKDVTRIPIISWGVFDEAERLIRAEKLGYRIGFLNVSHKKAAKVKRGIRMIHVWEATVDMMRVFWDIHFGKSV